jgi:hypothetical protein
VIASGTSGEIALSPAGSWLWDAVEPVLLRGEKILWVGQPDPGKVLAAGDWYLIPFSILWCGFAIFWEATAIAGGAGPFFVLWGVPFILVGLYLTVGRFFYRVRKKRRTIYAVTDKRVLRLLKERAGDTLQAAFVASIPAVNRRVSRDGSGTVIFGNVPAWQSMYANTGMDVFGGSQVADPSVAFYDIPDAGGVADLVERLRSGGDDRI